MAGAVNADDLAFRAKLLSIEDDLTDFAARHLPFEKVATAGANDDDEMLEWFGGHGANQYASRLPNKKGTRQGPRSICSNHDS